MALAVAAAALLWVAEGDAGRAWASVRTAGAFVLGGG